MNLNYPKAMIENERYRLDILNKAEEDIEFRKILLEYCRRNRLFVFNVFFYTYDPRTAKKDFPFITYDYQDDVILWDAECALKQEDNGVDKSRDMGCTWVFVGNDFFDWLFSPQRIEIRWGSRKEQYVDTRGDMDSIFEKFRYILDYLPQWFLPEGFSRRVHDNTMKLINPVTNSVISGEATNDQFGRGGRKYRIRFDEFAFWDCDKNAWKACADATNCRTALSTPNGMGNKFAGLMKGTKDPMKNKKHLHWTLHPHKAKGAYWIDKSGARHEVDTPAEAYRLWSEQDIQVRSPWYDAECGRRNEKEVAQELDIDYTGSGAAFYKLKELNKQKAWEYMKRELPTDPIPYGYYIKGKLVKKKGKVELRECEDGEFKIFELPRAQYEYAIGGDTSEGLPKGDESFGVCRDKIDRNVVATINGLYDPDDFAEYLYLLSLYYGEAITAPENNNHGFTTAKTFHLLGGNLYYSKSYETSKGDVVTSKRGFSTTSKTRLPMLDRNEEMVRRCEYEMRDETIIEQKKTFVRPEKKPNHPEADGDMLDDGVIADSICEVVIDEHPFKPRKNTSAKRAVRTETAKRQRRSRSRYAKAS